MKNVLKHITTFVDFMNIKNMGVTLILHVLRAIMYPKLGMEFGFIPYDKSNVLDHLYRGSKRNNKILCAIEYLSDLTFPSRSHNCPNRSKSSIINRYHAAGHIIFDNTCNQVSRAYDEITV